MKPGVVVPEDVIIYGLVKLINTDVGERPGGQPESGSELVRAEVRGLVNERNADFIAKLVPGRGMQVKAPSHASGRELKVAS